MPMIDLKQCVLTLEDGTPTTPNTLTLVLGDGTLTYDEKRAIEYKKNRGKLYQTRLGDEEPMDIRLDCMWEFIKSESGASVPTFEEVLKQTGPASTWVTSGSDECAPYAVDIKIVWTPPCAATPTEVYLLEEFRYESLSHDSKNGMIAVTGKCNVLEATITRV